MHDFQDNFIFLCFGAILTFWGLIAKHASQVTWEYSNKWHVIVRHQISKPKLFCRSQNTDFYKVETKRGLCLCRCGQQFSSKGAHARNAGACCSDVSAGFNQTYTFCILTKLPAIGQRTTPEPCSIPPDQTGSFYINKISIESCCSMYWREVFAIRVGGFERSLPCQCLTRSLFAI